MAALSAALITAAGRAEPATNDASFAVRYAAIEGPADTAPTLSPPSAGPLVGPPASAKPESPTNHSDALAYYRALIEKEAGRQGLAPAIAEAVMAVESGYNPGAIGGVGEIGLMQILPSTAPCWASREAAPSLQCPKPTSVTAWLTLRRRGGLPAATSAPPR
jgi:soluble lytic murein transglycosylase-like protein